MRGALRSIALSLAAPAAVLALASLTGCGGPPKVLIDHSYASSDKSIITYIVQSGASVGSGSDKTNLFNVFLRVCNQGADNTTAACKDTLVLSNVNPKSL